MKTQRKKLLAILVSLCLLCMIGSTTLVSSAASETSLQITGVGIFDNPAGDKGIHDFGNGAYLIQVTFNKDFWATETEQWVEWKESINDYLLINGKKATDWIDMSWGSVQLHVKKSAELGQYLEINLTNYDGLPKENTDNTIQLLTGFAGALESDVTYYYTANNNVPFTTTAPSTSTTVSTTTTTTAAPAQPLQVTGVGYFDEDPAVGIGNGDGGTKIIQVTFNKDFWATETQSYVELDALVNLKLLINGKTPSQWVGNYGDSTWGCVIAHVKKNTTLGQYLEITFDPSKATGLPSADADCTIQFLSGFAGALESDVTYYYTANNNVPFTTTAPSTSTTESTTSTTVSTTTSTTATPTPVTVTGVGIFDNPAGDKGIHTWSAAAKLIQVTFSGDFYDATQLGADGYKRWIQSEVGNYIKINGKTVSEWNATNINNIQIHVAVNSAIGGQILEFHMNDTAGLPTEATDNTVEILAGFPIYNQNALASSVTYYYTANNNVPFTTTAPSTSNTSATSATSETSATTTTTAAPTGALAVTGVGIFDQTPNKGLHHFSTDARMLQITFNQDFYDPVQLIGGRKDHLQGTDFAKYIKINGKTIYDWHINDTFNSVQVHVATNSALGGQFLEVHFVGLTDRLPTELTDSTVEILAGFPLYGGEALAESVTYYYTGRSFQPYSTTSPATTQPSATTTTTTVVPDGNAFEVVGVGVLDTDPKGAFVDFGDSDLFQVKFNKDLDNSGNMVAADKVMYRVQDIYGDYIAINGKLVSQWNAEEYNCVVIHIGKNDVLGQYLEFNVNETVSGLFNGNQENKITFLPGLPAGDGSTLQAAVTYTLAAGSTAPFVKAETAESIAPPTTTAPVDPSTIDLEVNAVGVLDQSPKKALHDFGSSFLWQIDFNKDFYNTDKLTGGRYDHLQTNDPDLCQYIIINGKTVAQWNEEMFNSVQIHVQTNPSFGQYLEMNTNAMLDGLVFPETDNYVTILAGFPCYNGEALKESVTFTMAADSTSAWVRSDEVIVPEVTTTTKKVTTTTKGGFDIVDITTTTTVATTTAGDDGDVTTTVADDETTTTTAVAATTTSEADETTTTTEKIADTESPDTGDTLPVLAILFLVVSSAALTVMMSKKAAAK